jgi:hypothetical protein
MQVNPAHSPVHRSFPRELCEPHDPFFYRSSCSRPAPAPAPAEAAATKRPARAAAAAASHTSPAHRKNAATCARHAIRPTPPASRPTSNPTATRRALASRASPCAATRAPTTPTVGMAWSGASKARASPAITAAPPATSRAATGGLPTSGTGATRAHAPRSTSALWTATVRRPRGPCRRVTRARSAGIGARPATRHAATATRAVRQAAPVRAQRAALPQGAPRVRRARPQAARRAHALAITVRGPAPPIVPAASASSPDRLDLTRHAS